MERTEWYIDSDLDGFLHVRLKKTNYKDTHIHSFEIKK